MDQPKTLVLTVGFPRSGKSTWACNLGEPIVSPDAIRLALHGQPFITTAEPLVWATAKLMVASLFIAGHDFVVLDACSHKPGRRAEWKDSRWEIKYAIFPTPYEELIRRAHATGRPTLVPIIDRMWNETIQLDAGIDPADVLFLRK